MTDATKTKHYRESYKFNLWVRYFTNISYKETHGNATKSALKAYNTTAYHNAAAIGYQNYKKLQHLSLLVADQLGYGFVDMMKIGLAKMMKGDYDDWDRMMVRLGHFEPERKVSVAIQNNYDFSNLATDLEEARRDRGLQM